MKALAVTVGGGGRRDVLWLDQSFAINTQSPVRGPGFNLNFGGIFTSVPAAAATMAHQPLVFSAAQAPVGAAVRLATRVGVPIDLGPLIHRLDLFGLGLDYAMYHKRLWSAFDKNDNLTPWQNLGGVFTSALATIA